MTSVVRGIFGTVEVPAILMSPPRCIPALVRHRLQRRFTLVARPKILSLRHRRSQRNAQATSGYVTNYEDSNRRKWTAVPHGSIRLFDRFQSAGDRPPDATMLLKVGASARCAVFT